MISLLASLTLASFQSDHEFTVAGSQITLSGIITTPELKPKAVVLMMPGSGPTDRDGNQPPLFITNVLKDISAELVKAGYATVRFDKRPVARYQSQWPKTAEEMSPYFNLANHLADATAVANYAKDFAPIKNSPLYLLGHSEGGLFAIALGQSLNAKGLLLLAAPGRNMGDIIIEQVQNNISKAPITEDQKKMYNSEMIRIVKELTASAKMPQNIPAGLAGLFNSSALNLLHDYFTFEPKPFAQEFKGSVFIANGTLDAQISAEKDAKFLNQIFSSRENAKTELFLAQSSSHNFKTVATVDEPGLSGPLMPELSSKIIRFLNSDLE